MLKIWPGKHPGITDGVAVGVGIGAGVVDTGETDIPFGSTVNESSLPRVASKPPALRSGVKVTVIDSFV